MMKKLHILMYNCTRSHTTLLCYLINISSVSFLLAITFFNILSEVKGFESLKMKDNFTQSHITF